MLNRPFIFLVIIVALTAGFSSCQPDPIDIGVAPAPAKLVVTSQIIPGQTMIVGLTRSFSALSSEGNGGAIDSTFLDSVLVSGAQVTVRHPGGRDTLFEIAPGIYASINVLLSSYGSYTLYAKDVITNLEVTAATQLLPAVDFDSIVPVFTYTPGDTTIFIHYEITDLPTESNYFVLNYYRLNRDTSASFDPNTFFQRGQNQLVAFDLISDTDFDQNGRLTRDRELTTVGTSDTIAVTLSHITKGYYEFLTAYKRSGSLLNQLTGEPINFPSNVEGGYGYFNAHFPSVRFFNLRDYQ
jgi:hypothetical protein